VTAGPLPGLGLFSANPTVLWRQRGDLRLDQARRSRQATVVTVALPAQKLGGATGYAQLVQPSGQVLRSDAVGPGLP